MSKWLKEFKNPSKEYRAVPFWSWNDKLDPEFLRWQIREMDKVGLGGYFMHARGGLQTEYLSDEWMECIAACIDEGKKTGMNSWCYDEEGWPSGFAGGIVTGMGDKYHVRWLEMEEFNSKASLDEQVLGVYILNKETNQVKFISPDSGVDIQEGQRAVIIKHKSNPYYIDILNPEVVKAFIDSTYEKYYSEFKDEFGKGMPGFFTDEPQYSRGNIPWSYILPEKFKEKHGYDVIPYLAALFVECEGYEKVRYDFWSLVNELYVNSFGKQIYDWCEEHDCQLTGHVMMEDSIFAQMGATAGAMTFYEYMHIPGIDWLTRAISSPVIPKQVSSVANQLGKKFVLTETFGLSGWNVSFEELKWIAEWQYVNGVNLMCQHLESYTLRGLRKRDYPPSLFYHQPWWSEYKLFNDYFARLGVLLTSGKDGSNVLLLHPMKSGWITFNSKNNEAIQKIDKDFVEATNTLSDLHIGHHYGDETIIKKYGKIQGKEFVVGQCSYEAVVMPSMVSIDESTIDLLLEFIDKGGKVISIGDFPRFTSDTKKLEELRDKVVHIKGCRNELYSYLKDIRIPKISIEDQGGQISAIHYLQRDVDKEQLFFLVNHDQNQTFDAVVSIPKEGRLRKVNAETGEIEDIDFESKDSYTKVNLEFLPMQSHILLFDYEKVQKREIEDVQEKKIELGKDWDIEEVGYNSLTIDYCEYRIDDGPWQGPLPVIKLMDILLERKTNCEIELKFSFEVDMDLEKNKEFFLAIETADEFQIKVNGTPIEYKDQGWWKDSAFMKVDIKDQVKIGHNEVILKRTFYQDQKVYDILFGENVLETEKNKLTFDVELESIYVVGDFGVISKSPYSYGERRAVFTDGPFVIVDMPKKVTSGDLTQQGFCFFADSIRLGQDINVNIEDKQRLILDLGKPDAVVSKVFVNGKPVKTLLWAPYCVDITDFVKPGLNRISIELFHGNRNLLGPHHHIDGESYSVGPSSFTDKPGWSDGFGRTESIWRNGYCFVRFGLKE